MCATCTFVNRIVFGHSNFNLKRIIRFHSKYRRPIGFQFNKTRHSESISQRFRFETGIIRVKAYCARPSPGAFWAYFFLHFFHNKGNINVSGPTPLDPTGRGIICGIIKYNNSWPRLAVSTTEIRWLFFSI